MVRAILMTVLMLVVARAFWRVVDGIIRGAGGAPRRTGSAGSTAPPAHGVQMARDPVCGTFVVPGRAVALDIGRERVYFCSTACRDQYRARSA